ncbi:MAG: GTPase Era [Oscillospiraceae bacterium]|nr:GTPase Era [Candidatus Equicaccousia limihippi]
MNNTKSAFIAVVGRANVGKSSFINRVIGNKVSIVSDKPQTTRTKIMGVLNKDETQIVFIDTPGFHKPKNLLGEKMVSTAKEGLSQVDAVLFMADASYDISRDGGEINPTEQALLKSVKKVGVPVILGINKIDKIEDKTALLEIISMYSGGFEFDEIFPISVADGDGIDMLLKKLLGFAAPSPHYFPDDAVSDQPDKLMVSELIREKILRLYDKEIPHGVAVDIERFFEKDTVDGEPLLVVEATVYCEKESHKGILIGKQGAALKKTGTLARHDIEKFFGIKVSLKLWVKVKEDRRNRGGLIHTFGLD